MLEQYSGWIKRFLYFATTAVILLAGTAACSQSSTTTNVPTGTPITIGYSYSTSGDFKDDGIAMDQGYQLWADSVNSSGGILGHPVQLVKLTDKSDPGDPNKSVPGTIPTNYQTLITKDHVDFVFGPFSSLLTVAAIPVAQKYGYVLLEGSGGGPGVFAANPDPKKAPPVAFDVSLPVVHNLDSFAYYILSLPPNQRPTTVAYASESDDPFTGPQVQEAQSILTIQGKIRQVGNFSYTSDPKNFPEVAKELINAHADMVVVGAYLPDTSAFINAFKKAHYFPKAFVATAGPDLGPTFAQAVGGLANTEGVFVPNGWYPTANNFQNAQMVQDYLNKYGGSANNINADTAEAYSVGQVFQQALTKAGKISNAALLNELQNDTFDTVQGAVKFDSIGENLAALPYLFQWQNGSLIPVFPPIAAAAIAEYPSKQATV
ncbi:MAG TPA: amino acid ABC transporter substrate-binding protein [Ktedonobacteraceae bacterium]|nr:amino acid ABC transporter substrate-binding protein [Ktedonobacteraceae bacterium]